MLLGRSSSQRPHVGVFSGSPSSKPTAHFGVSLLFENIHTPRSDSSLSATAPNANPTISAVMSEDQCANRTFAIVKPDALTPFKYQQINALIKLNEFDISRQKLVWLTEEHAVKLFPDHADSPDRREWLDYITCAPCLALELAKPDATLFWQIAMGCEDPHDQGNRDPDSIRGILATDRIRNAVDGSQEPEDAARQLALAFSDSIPAMPYDGFLMERADEARCTLALIKPDIAQEESAIAKIIERIVARGYEIKDRVEITLSRSQVTSFYSEHEGKEFFEGLVSFMSSGPTIALLLEGDDVIRGWRTMIGPTSPDSARAQVPLSIRALFGVSGPRNAVHGSDSIEAAQRELSFFFSPRIQPEDDPLTPAETAVEDTYIASTAVAAGSAASSEDKKKKKKKPKRRSKRKQAVTANPDETVFANGAGSLSDESDDELDTSAPITPSATHIRFDQQLMPESEPSSADAPAQELELEIESEPASKAHVLNLAVAANPDNERTFALIKPDAYPRYHKQLVKHIVERGLAVVAQEEVQLTAAAAKQIYSDMSGFPVFPRLIDFVTSGPSLALVLEGRNAVAVWRSMAGPTNAKSAKFEAPESLRARYGQDAQMNAVHASYDLREARQSIEAVFYGMLEGQFRVMQPEDDPLSVGMSPKQTPVAQVAEEAFVEEPAVEVAQDAAEPSEAIEEDLGEQQPPCAAVEETCLVSQMETLAVSAALQNDITEEMLEPKKENAEDEEPQAVDVVQIAANQLSPPQTPPQTKVPVGDKAHPLGSRLASSPFLKADRQLGNEAPSATKKVGRIKSPFLGNGHDETAGATLGAEAHAESERSAFEPTQVPTDQDGTKLRERLEGLCLNSSAQAEELAGEEEAASMDAAAQREPEAAAEAPEVPISSEAAAAPEQPAENAKAPEAANGTPRPTRPGQQTGPTPSKTPAQPLRGTQTRGAVPAQTASSARATATRAVPASAMAQRTVRRVGPAAGPASGASPSAPAGSRRVTLGPAPVASRPRVSPAAPATPSVTTRAAARAAGPTPLAARSTPSVARATPSKAPVPVASRTVPPKPAVPAASRATSSKSAVPAASRATPSKAPVLSTTRTTPSKPPVSSTTRTTPSKAAVPVVSRTTPSKPPAPVASRTTPSKPPVPVASRTTPSKPPVPVASRLTASKAAVPGSVAPGSAAPTAAGRRVAAAGAAASPRPITRSMASTAAPVTSTASSRARAAAAAAARAGRAGGAAPAEQ